MYFQFHNFLSNWTFAIILPRGLPENRLNDLRHKFQNTWIFCTNAVEYEAWCWVWIIAWMSNWLFVFSWMFLGLNTKYETVDSLVKLCVNTEWNENFRTQKAVYGCPNRDTVPLICTYLSGGQDSTTFLCWKTRSFENSFSMEVNLYWKKWFVLVYYVVNANNEIESYSVQVCLKIYQITWHTCLCAIQLLYMKNR